MDENLELDYKDIADWVLLQSPVVQENIKIVSSVDLGQDFQLHIDKNLVKNFLPMMPKSASSQENASAPRVTVAPALIGCMIGYFRCVSDFLDGPGEHIKGDPYKGGYTIVKLPFKHCLKPNSKLCFDAERSDEHWLVNYNQDNVDYPSVEIGKLFITEIRMVAGVKKEPKVFITGYIYHNQSGGIRLNNVKTLLPGYSKIEISYDTQDSWDVNDQNNYTVSTVDEGEYLDCKKLSAALLSHQDSPNFLKW